MKSILSYPGNMAHAQQIARALFEHDALEGFVTTFAYREDGRLARVVRALPREAAGKILLQLQRRRVGEVPAQLVYTHPLWEIVRSGLAQLGAGPVLLDRAWDAMSHAFDGVVANRYVPNTQCIHAFEYTGLASFERARQLGVATVLHLPSLDSKSFEEIRCREQAQWPEFANKHDAYFARMFERRYQRRQAEIGLADIIIANSSLTKRSHVAAGADPEKVFVVPLAAPPVDSRIEAPGRRSKLLSVVWSGSFSLGKGAQYFVEAWRGLRAGGAAQAKIYGAMSMPAQAIKSLPEELDFRGSVPQSELFEAFRTADVLVFPTLSDGFGMVVTEAMAHGLPVITTNQAGAADLVEHGRNGLIVQAGDVRALREALQWCLDNRHVLSTMRQAALETARKHQWRDFRRELIGTLETGLRLAGYVPRLSVPGPLDADPRVEEANAVQEGDSLARHERQGLG